MTIPDSGWIDPNPPDPINSRTPVILAVSGALLTVMVVATLVGVVLFNADDDGDRSAEKVVLIAANSTAAEPFARSIVVAPLSISTPAATKVADLLAQVPVRADRGVRLVSGVLPGLYGATGQTYPCDVVTLANDLDADPATAQAWGLALGITPQQIPFYLNTLTAVVLMADTWVTTHTLREGAANAKQAVLQAGNAVLVDPIGVPRVQCASSAPLTPPDNDTLRNYRVDGDQWAEYTPQTVIAVEYAATETAGPVAEFTLIDINTGQQIVRKVGDVINLGGASLPLPNPAVMNVPPLNRSESGDR